MIFILVKKYNWNKQENPKYGAYASSGDQWVSYNDLDSVQAKADHILKKDYGGAALYFMDSDDFMNRCCNGPSPLMNTVGKALRGVGKVSKGNCQRPPPISTPRPPEVTTGFDDGGHLTTSKSWKPSNRPTTSRPTTTSAWWTPTSSASTSAWWTPSTTKASPPSSSGGGSKPGGIKSGAKCNQVGSTFSHESDCQKYYRCVNKKLLLQKCSQGLLWNNGKGRCDWPNQVSCGTRSGMFLCS